MHAVHGLSGKLAAYALTGFHARSAGLVWASSVCDFNDPQRICIPELDGRCSAACLAVSLYSAIGMHRAFLSKELLANDRECHGCWQAVMRQLHVCLPHMSAGHSTGHASALVTEPHIEAAWLMLACSPLEGSPQCMPKGGRGWQSWGSSTSRGPGPAFLREPPSAQGSGMTGGQSAALLANLARVRDAQQTRPWCAVPYKPYKRPGFQCLSNLLPPWTRKLCIGEVG